MKKVVIAVTGSSGAVYAKVLFERLAELRGQWARVGVVFSENALVNWRLELGSEPDFSAYPFEFFAKNDFHAPFASGSAKFDTMLVCPCSMGTLARIATGISNDLITRAADVMLKERRRLILLTRETPLSLIHLTNMVSITQAGGVVMPACPSFYSRPETLDDLAKTVVDRALDLAGFELESFRWGKPE